MNTKTKREFQLSFPLEQLVINPSQHSDSSNYQDVLSSIVETCLSANASDIHIEPFQSKYRLRARIDGVLVPGSNLSLGEGQQLLNRIKLLANLDIAQQRLPQDGRFCFKHGKALNAEFRISCIPTANGEKLVMRLVNSNPTQMSLDSIGFTQEQLELFTKVLKQKQGFILVSGPTGAGKSMTLYSALQLLNQNEINVCSVEDPVELNIDGVCQVQVNSAIELDFAPVLKSLLRQDPDVIMVGEIRDLETANIAVRAAQTGHLVLSTVHSNSALASISRLQSLGVAKHELTSALSLLVAQRLVRKLCDCCKQPAEQKTRLIRGETITIDSFKPLGCANCVGGYKGRHAIFELISVDSKLIKQLNRHDSVEEIALVKHHNLLQAGLRLVQQGTTSLAELEKVIHFEHDAI